jgi:uncharacterized protein with ATP-grasp and redox domains
MKVYYECGSCFLRQAREAMDLATDDDNLKIDLMKSVFDYLSQNYKTGASSNKLGTTIHRMIKDKTNCFDPYIKEKEIGNNIAIELLPEFQKILEDDDSLENFVKIAIIGNILDFGALGLNVNLENLISMNLDKNLAINDINEFKKNLNTSNSLLYLADNTGEIVFDKLLVEKLIKDYDINITFAVKNKPILNDACYEDGISVGLNKITNLVTTGTDSIGIIYEDLSPEFREIFNNHDLIVSKGLGNYEGLTELSTEIQDKNVFCFLCAKCTAIAKDISVNNQDMVCIKL